MKTGQYTIEDKIDDVTVSSTMFNPLEVYRIAPRVAKIFLPILSAQTALASLASKAGVPDMDKMQLLKMIDVKQFMPLAIGILDQLSTAENAKLPQELLARTELHMRDADGKLRIYQLGTDSEINDAFRGRIMLMLKVMWFAASFNFADFIGGSGQTDRISSSNLTA